MLDRCPVLNVPQWVYPGQFPGTVIVCPGTDCKVHPGCGRRPIPVGPIEKLWTGFSNQGLFG